MIPFCAARLVVHYDNGLERLGAKYFPGLTKHPVDYFRMFYGDTALNGNPSALRCGLDFFGEDHILFGTDMPYDVENGGVSIRETIKAIEAMGHRTLSGRRFMKQCRKVIPSLRKAFCAGDGVTARQSNTLNDVPARVADR